MSGVSSIGYLFCLGFWFFKLSYFKKLTGLAAGVVRLVVTHSVRTALGSARQETTRNAAPGKWTSVLSFVSSTGNSSHANISGAVYKHRQIFQ